MCLVLILQTVIKTTLVVQFLTIIILIFTFLLKQASFLFRYGTSEQDTFHKVLS